MMEPPETSCPPNDFTPSRCALESRPFRELPRPFLCAIGESFVFAAQCRRCRGLKPLFLLPPGLAPRAKTHAAASRLAHLAIQHGRVGKQSSCRSLIRKRSFDRRKNSGAKFGPH